MDPQEYLAEVEIAWCPGCGNFAIREALAQALAELGLPPWRVVLVTGIGQAAKIVHYLRVNGFNGLHGRAVPAAAGIKLARPDLVVIVESGDGDLYGEGGNHLIHNIRRNLDITVIAHDNRVYGLTKGQASPTADFGYKTKVQPFGTISAPFHPLALAIALNAAFVAQAFSGDVEGTARVIAEAVRHRGFSLVNVLHPCPTWNRVNTFAWYRSRVYSAAEAGHDPTDRRKALELVLSSADRIPVGVIYRREALTFEDLHPVIQKGPPALRSFPTKEEVLALLSEFL